MPCLFCRIAAGEADAALVFQDELTIAFLDSRPLFPGHTLLIPRRHIETLGDLPDGLVAPVFASARTVARAVEIGTGAEGTFVAINNRVSQSVPHLHVHIVPRRKKDGLRGFFWPRRPYSSKEEMESVAEAIRRATLGSKGGERDGGG